MFGKRASETNAWTQNKRAEYANAPKILIASLHALNLLRAKTVSCGVVTMVHNIKILVLRR